MRARERRLRACVPFTGAEALQPKVVHEPEARDQRARAANLGSSRRDLPLVLLTLAQLLLLGLAATADFHLALAFALAAREQREAAEDDAETVAAEVAEAQRRGDVLKAADPQAGDLRLRKTCPRNRRLAAAPLGPRRSQLLLLPSRCRGGTARRVVDGLEQALGRHLRRAGS